MCSDIEPETSIRQNMTACATGFGTGSKRRYRMSIGSRTEFCGLLPLTPLFRPRVRSGAPRHIPPSRLPAARSFPAVAAATPPVAPARARLCDRSKYLRASRRSISGAVDTLAFRFRKFTLGEIRQFKVIEEQVDELVPAQNKPERILTVALTRLVTALSATPTLSWRDAAFDRLLVAREYHVARSALAAKARLVHTIERNAYFSAFQDILDVAVL